MKKLKKPGNSSGSNIKNKVKKVCFIITAAALLVFLTGAAAVFYILVPYPRRRVHTIPENNLATVKSFDNLDLAAELVMQTHESHKWAVLIHSYRTDHTVMHKFGQRYFSRGYNLLYPDNRAHGNSGGAFIGMGYLDRLDILAWIEYILKMDPEAEIILHGLSMGASTALMVSGIDDPALDHVRAVIADCGPASAESYLTNKLKQRFHLPPFPLLPIANIAAKIAAGYYLEEASTVEFAKKSRTPALIIHGDVDESVPVNNAYTLYDAVPVRKELLIVKGAGHSECSVVDPEEYWITVSNFIEGKSIHG